MGVFQHFVSVYVCFHSFSLWFSPCVVLLVRLDNENEGEATDYSVSVKGGRGGCSSTLRPSW